LGSGAHNPLVRALPAVIALPLSDLEHLSAALDLLFAEGSSEHCGRQAALDRLMEYVLILLLRHLLNRNNQTRGLLAALADPRLTRAVNAMHAQPRQRWTLETLAAQAGMSRARFALLFHQITGVTPLAYLTDWRLGLAQALLTQGKSISTTADAVGYGSAAAFSRVFMQHIGLSPRLWLARQR
jgi:transcriptional regulator GlxA family with amidase domain